MVSAVQSKALKNERNTHPPNTGQFLGGHKLLGQQCATDDLVETSLCNKSALAYMLQTSLPGDQFVD